MVGADNVINSKKMIKKRKSRQNTLNLIIFTSITIFCWIGFRIYQAVNQSTVSTVLKEQLEPLNSNFDKKTLESLKERRIISQEEIDSAPEAAGFKLEEEKLASSSSVLIQEEQKGIETKKENEQNF